MVEFCGKCGKPCSEQEKLCTCMPVETIEPEILALEETRELEVLTLEETKELEVLSMDETKELEILSTDDSKEPEILSLEKTSELEVIKPSKKNKTAMELKDIEKQPVQEPTITRKNKMIFLKQCLVIIMNYIKNPIEVIDEKLNSYKISHIISILILNSFTFGLFATVLLEDILNEFYGIILKVSDYISFSEKITLIEIPYIKSVLTFSILCFIFVNAMSFLTTIIINKVLKLKTSITKVIKVYGITSITATITFIISCISSLLNTHLTPIILFIGLFLNQYYINLTMSNVCRNKDNNKLGYAIAISPIIVISTIFLLIISLI